MHHAAHSYRRVLPAALAFSLLSAPVFADPAVTATQRDSFPDPNSDNKAAVGEVITYETIIANGGNMAAQNLGFVSPTPGNTTFDPLSVKSTPLARDDSYAATGNVGLSIGDPGLLGNDFDLGPTIPTVVAGSGMTAQGGSVTVNPTGGFTYLPPVGFVGLDSFSYTIADESGAVLPTPATGSNVATVTITIQDMIWFINDSGGGDGTFTTPYNLTQHAANGNDMAGDTIYLFPGTYTGGLTLLNNQKLIGAGSTVGFQTASGIALAPGSFTIPTNTSSPFLVSGTGIELASGNTIRGLDIGNTSPGAGITATSFGTLTIRDVNITGAGGGVDLADGVLDVAFGELSSSGNDRGIDLRSVTGSFDVSSGTINTTGQRGVSVSGPGTRTLGITLDSVSSSGADHGIFLSNTDGSFTVAGDGNSATQGGNDSGGIISNTTGDGISLTNVVGVTLNNMTIGDTNASPSDSPSSIENIRGDGIEANNSSGLVLNNVTISHTGGHGLNSDGLNGFTLRDSQILNAGNDQEEHGLNLDNLAGTSFVIDCLFDAFNESGIEVVNSSGTAGLTVSGTTFQDNKATVGNAGEEGILLEASGTAQIFLHVRANCLFTELSREGVQGISLGISSQVHMTFEGSSITETSSGDGLIICNPDNTGSAFLLVKDSTLTDASLGPFGVLAKNDSSGELHVTVDNVQAPNVQIINQVHDDLGSGGAANGTSYVHMEDCVNLVGSENIGADFISSESALDAPVDVHLTLLRNDIRSTDENFFTFVPGIRIVIQGNTREHMDIQGNTAVGAPSTSGANGMTIQEFDASDGRIEDLTGAADVFINNRNNIDNGVFLSGTYVSGAADEPSLPTLP